ncbi:MAG: hypothetical protein V1855_00340, partial [bacterium]
MQYASKIMVSFCIVSCIYFFSSAKIMFIQHNQIVEFLKKQCDFDVEKRWKLIELQLKELIKARRTLSKMNSAWP